jgi:hypothetical protein
LRATLRVVEIKHYVEWGIGMAQRAIRKSPVKALVAIAIALGIAGNAPRTAKADEGGVSFWLPGIYGSLAATPQQPGWSLPLIYYHTTVSQSGSIAAAKEVRVFGLSKTLSVNLDLNLKADGNIGLLIPTYVFPTPVLGGQLALGMMVVTGRNSASLDGTLTASLGPFSVTRTGRIDSSVSGFGDLAPQASLRWNMGVHNFMIYGTGDIPVGAYDPNRLANLGIGHGAIDGGLGYTYFNPLSGFEASVVSGLTYNFENPDTNYRNGVDWHTDWGVSQFLSKQFFVGAVGYAYNQITADSGQPAFLGSNESRVYGIGPQIGYIFPINNQYQGYLNLKGYSEFDASRRPEGWNVWVTFAISPAAPAPTAPPRTAMMHR